ncbi:CHAP domain-containing protein, partial [Lusitaniella coriacea LEGE 07157]
LRQEKGSFASADTHRMLETFLSNGDGTFRKAWQADDFAMNGDLTDLLVGDFNGDGKTDFLRQEHGVWDDDSFNTSNLFLSNGDGTFRQMNLPENFDLKGDLTHLHMSDFNGDGKTDFLRQEKGDWDNDAFNTANAFLSLGNGSFQKVVLPEGFHLSSDNGTKLYTNNARPWEDDNIILKANSNNLTFHRGQEWLTPTGYKFVFQDDGNLVLYTPQGKPIWATGTDNTTADVFAVQTDGNVVLYDRGKPIWATDTAGHAGAYFMIQGDGNLVVYSSDNKPLFNTGTDGGRTGTFAASPEWLNKHNPQPQPQPQPPVQLHPILSYAEFSNWRNWAEYTSRNPFPSKGKNCTWYAHGRMMQLGYSEYALDSMWGNAGTWDNTAGRGAVVTGTPQVPCIAVWEIGVGGAGSVGHVGVVERVNADGSILISESNWAGTAYNTRTIYPGSRSWPSKFITIPKA